MLFKIIFMCVFYLPKGPIKIKENASIQIISSHFKMIQIKHFPNTLRSTPKEPMMICVQSYLMSNREVKNGREFQESLRNSLQPLKRMGRSGKWCN